MLLFAAIGSPCSGKEGKNGFGEGVRLDLEGIRPQSVVMPNSQQTREGLKALLLQKSVRTGHFKLASGKESDLYIDCRTTTLDAMGANMVGALGWAKVRDNILPRFPEASAIGGMTMGADPISLSVGMASALELGIGALRVFIVRKEAKGHGCNRRIEGNFKPGDEVIVVDDVITTGGSTIKAIDAIEEEGGKVVAALVLVDREEGGREAIEARGVPVYAIFTRKQLLNE